MKKALALTVAGAAIIMAAGCSALGRQALANPVVTLKNVRVVGLGLTGGNLDVELNVHNPNDFRLDATRMAYNVLIESDSLAHGVMDNQFTVAGKDSAVVHIPVTFTYAGIGAAGRALRNSGAVNYRVCGAVTVGSIVGNVTVPFSQTGRFSTLGR